MSGLSSVSASQGWFAPAQTSAAQGGGSGSGAGLAQAISQVLSGNQTATGSSTSLPGASATGAVSGKLQSALLNLQSLGAQPAASGNAAHPGSATSAGSTSVGGSHRHHHHGHGLSSDSSTNAAGATTTDSGSSLPAAISATADDIGTIPNAIQPSVSKAIQSYLSTSSALSLNAAA